MATVESLRPGDQVTQPGLGTATYITDCPHPLYPALRLVIWRLHQPGHPWSHDALLARQEIGDVAPATDEIRLRRLRGSLFMDVDEEELAPDGD